MKSNGNNERRKLVVVAVVFSIIGFAGGAGLVLSSKASRFADDAHAVKEDYDKAKGRVAEDYRHAADKAKEAIDKTDTAAIASTLTTEGKKLSKEGADGLRDLGKSWKDKLKAKMEKDK